MSGGGGGGGGGGTFYPGGGGGTVSPSAECPGGHCALVQNVRGDITHGGTIHPPTPAGSLLAAKSDPGTNSHRYQFALMILFDFK